MIYLSKAIKTQSYQNSLVKYILSFLQWLWYVGIRDFMLKEVVVFFFFLCLSFKNGEHNREQMSSQSRSCAGQKAGEAAMP